ncbi:hypothetical protein ABHN03_25295 [Paenibacillus sp. NRS-1775]|uniref:hypothetical protein n=1 Tax=unclassified Paenibacillus TaxID=185978 RepID=UPI003D2941CA
MPNESYGIKSTDYIYGLVENYKRKKDFIDEIKVHCKNEGYNMNDITTVTIPMYSDKNNYGERTVTLEKYYRVSISRT